MNAGSARIRIASNVTRLVIEWAAAREAQLPVAEAQLAELAGLGTDRLTPSQRATMLRKIARGGAVPKLETLDRLAAALEVDVQRFLDPVQ
jgi:transcriptional regulator with XRE-family HTH domain